MLVTYFPLVGNAPNTAHAVHDAHLGHTVHVDTQHGEAVLVVLPQLKKSSW